MLEYVTYVICCLLLVMLYVNNSVMGADQEIMTLDRVRNSSGYLIKYGQEN